MRPLPERIRMPNHTTAIGAVAIGVAAIAAGVLNEIPAIREARLDRKIVREAFKKVDRMVDDPRYDHADVMNERWQAYYVKYDVRNAKKNK
jgi:hypothetical protein